MLPKDVTLEKERQNGKQVQKNRTRDSATTSQSHYHYTTPPISGVRLMRHMSPSSSSFTVRHPKTAHLTTLASNARAVIVHGDTSRGPLRMHGMKSLCTLSVRERKANLC